MCDDCHSSDALVFLDRMAESEKSTEPREIVEIAFRHPSFSFHGPEHHSLVPAAIMIAMKNRGLKKSDGEPVTVDIVRHGIRRGSKIPGGYCGYAGTCGACVGAGIAIALYLGSTPKRGPQRKEAHAATIAALTKSEDGLVRCCKRATLYGISAAMEILRDDRGMDLGEIPQFGSCRSWEKNRDCAKEDCIFYPDQASG